MTDDLSPEGINKAHGKASWKCWGCKAETGLHWHNGWSVAMCNKPECAKGYNDMCREQVEAQERFDAYAERTIQHINGIALFGGSGGRIDRRA